SGVNVGWCRSVSTEVILAAVLAAALIWQCSRAGRDKATLKSALTTAQSRVTALETHVATLTQTIANLRAEEALRQDRAQRGKAYALAHDVSDPANQRRFIEDCDLRAARPVNKEAVRVLYALDEWIKTDRPDWRLSFEVGMGAFIKTAYGADDRLQAAAFSSYNSKRVDFLLIDRFGQPRLAVEYHGTGHALSEDADDRMNVKRLALERAGIPLVEIPAKASRADILIRVGETLADSAPVKASA
ncbi:MAG: DUF2726 domain-containing protein, partial [Phenylobacterium sp.]